MVALVPLCIACGARREPESESRETEPAAARDSPEIRVGLDAFTHLEELPLLQRGVRAHGASSAAQSTATTVSDGFDPNDDYSNYVSEAAGERVLLDVTGRGAIYRFWHTDDGMDAWAPGGPQPRGADITYNVYFDGAESPALRLASRALWGGELAAFAAPLSLDADASSGGAVTYRPITFARGIKITAQSARDYPLHDYFNIAYNLYDAETRIRTFRGGEDSSEARRILAHVGENPIRKLPQDITTEDTYDLKGGSTTTVGRFEGPGMITELVIHVPEMRREEYPVIADEGRSTLVSSSFELEIDPRNTSVRMIRRLAAAQAQVAQVYIDSRYAGRWETRARGEVASPTRAVNAWLDSAFEIPKAHTANKSRIHVRLDVESPAGSASATPWTEFRYWAQCVVSGYQIQTDELDVGDAKSEAAHSYAMVEPNSLERARYRPVDPIVKAGRNDDRALGALRMQMFWDDDAAPAVDVPLAEFFGTGAGFVARVKSLMVGHEQGRFYSYFPMPYERSARIALVSPAGTPALSGVSVAVRSRPYAMDFAKVGYFYASARRVLATRPGEDYDALRVEGQGHYVGTNLILPGLSWTLEGDERVFVDGLRTPSISGTGTEDYVNGGWYWSRGPFSAPLSGMPERAEASHPISAYRLHITDAIPFRTSLRVAFEHDGVGSNTVPYASVAYYYLKREPGMTELASFEPADEASAAAHAFSAGDQSSVDSVTSRFFNDALPTAETRLAVSSPASSEFTLEIDPGNAGIVLRRVFDQALRDQRAEVFVDDVSAGLWHAAGGNDAFRWREDEFWIPSELTRDRSAVTVRLDVKSPTWNAAEYRVFALSR